MELEKMINDTQDLSHRLHAVIGPWDGNLLGTHLVGGVGRLADDVMTIEGKLALSVENVRLARNIADALIQLIRLSNMYHIALERALTQLLQDGPSGLSNESSVATLSDT